MLNVSQQTVGSNTPFIQALLEEAPQFQTHLAWLVILEFGILQNPGQTASLSLVPLKDCQQKNNHTAQNCKFNALYISITFNNIFVFHRCTNVSTLIKKLSCVI
jgi:hypothetical protein